jgi:glucokinase
VACAIGIANPILGDRVQMTNHHWSFSISELQSAVGLQRLIVIDDFTALDLSLPALTRADLRQIGGGVAVEGTPMAVLGPGTGLGVSGLFCVGAQAGFLPVNGEGGHVSLSPADDQEAAVIRRLQIRFGHASAERALSGPGLVNLYEAACSMASAAADRLAPSDVLERAVSSSERHCTTALELFCSFLGGVAGNLALTLGARGGVYIGGGIAPRIVGEIERSMFRARFEAKGRFADCLVASTGGSFVRTRRFARNMTGWEYPCTNCLPHSFCCPCRCLRRCLPAPLRTPTPHMPGATMSAL